MEAQTERPAEEVKRLRRCISDLIGVVALPAVWGGGEPAEIVRALTEALLGMLRLDLIYVRSGGVVNGRPVEMIRVAEPGGPAAGLREVAELLDRWVGDDPQNWPESGRHNVGGVDVTLVPLRLGLEGELGVIVAGSRRVDFPWQTERLVLSVAANQAAVGLQQALILSEQRRVADELDERVARRTGELAAANEELLREVAERRRAEEALRRSEAFLAEAQHLSLTGSFCWRIEAGEITWSEQAYHIFGFDPDVPMTPEIIRTRVHPEDLPLFDETLGWARTAGGDFEFEHRLLMPDRSTKHLHVIAHGSRHHDGEPEYVGAVQDVTERRLSEEALGRLRSELAHVSRVAMLGALTASIAHEVNQPLAGIVTNASTCLRMLGADPPNVEGARETARRTIRDGHRAADVITRLRALFSRKGAATELVDMNDATREVIALSLSELQSSRVILRTELAEDLPPVTGDRVQLQQVTQNLLRNALDAMSGVEDRPRHLLIRTGRDGVGCVRLSVQDSGVGLDPQNADRLFEAFYTTKDDGMGIGLSVSRSIIENHQGHLWAEPNDGPGATFSFSIPHASGAATAAPGLGVAPTPPPSDAGRASGGS